MRALSLLLLFSCIAVGQGVFDKGHEIFRGTGEDESSKPFTMSGPFVLSWTLVDIPPADTAARKYRTPYDTKHPAWIAFQVIDSKTGEVVARASHTGMDGNKAILQGGTYHLVCTSYDNVDWIMRAKEGKLVRTEKGDSIVPVTAEERKSTGQAKPPSVIAEAETSLPDNRPVPIAKPSSIPGAPNGLDKAKDATLPPGMQRK